MNKTITSLDLGVVDATEAYKQVAIAGAQVIINTSQSEETFVKKKYRQGVPGKIQHDADTVLDDIKRATPGIRRLMAIAQEGGRKAHGK